ncbi:MAG: hypothetical protein M3R57_03235 [Chloroflexota bacterium]|nr:hypothetical protein [Chloroflexota bacterium]
MPNLVDAHSTHVARNTNASTSRVIVANLNGDSRIQRKRTHIAMRVMQ